MPSSDSDSLPDLSSFLGPPKRKKPTPRQASTGPIELTSDDEPKLPPPKRKRKSARKLSSTNVIDLCSDDHEITPRPPRKARKSQTRASREDEIIVLSSSDDEEPPARRSQPSGSKRINSDRKSLSLTASVPPIEILRSEENGFAADTDSTSGQPELSTHQMSTPPASPVADIREALLPTNRQVNSVLPVEDRMMSEPLQHIYNEAFQSKSHSEEVKTPSPVFSWKSRSKPTKVCEPHPLTSCNPPLLTPGFFKRAREALAAPQTSTTSVKHDFVKGSSTLLQRATTTVKNDLVLSPHSSVTLEVGERDCPKHLSPGPSPQKSQADCATAVEEITENDDLPGISPSGVVEAAAPHTASSSSPANDPSPSKKPQTEFAEQANTLNNYETTHSTSRISPSTLPPKSTTTSKTVPTDLQQINARGPSEGELQEIEAMLLPEVSTNMTDEELLAMGLCYPEY